MFNSFLDGSKPAIESTAVANATGLTPAPDGLAFPPCAVEDLPFVMRPASEGGHARITRARSRSPRRSSATAAPIPYEIRKGVWVVFEAATEYQKNCFEEYMLHTDPSGRYSVHVQALAPDRARGRHVGGLGRPAQGADRLPDRLPRRRRSPPPSATSSPARCSTARAATRSTASCSRPRSRPALGSLPLGLAHNVKLLRPIKAGQSLTYADVAMDECAHGGEAPPRDGTGLRAGGDRRSRRSSHTADRGL